MLSSDVLISGDRNLMVLDKGVRERINTRMNVLKEVINTDDDLIDVLFTERCLSNGQVDFIRQADESE